MVLLIEIVMHDQQWSWPAVVYSFWTGS